MCPGYVCPDYVGQGVLIRPGCPDYVGQCVLIM